MQKPKGLLSPVLALLTACTFPAAVMGADNPPAPQSTAADTAQGDSKSKPPMVTHNADGTMTIRKEPANADAKDGKAKTGLIIRPQVVVPTIPARKKKYPPAQSRGVPRRNLRPAGER